jgi:hypothetical protein
MERIYYVPGSSSTVAHLRLCRGRNLLMLKAEIPTNDFTQLDDFFFLWYVKIDRSMMIGTLWTEQSTLKRNWIKFWCNWAPEQDLPAQLPVCCEKTNE